MTTLDAVQLAPSLQALVDARLDTIERMLMGKLPRQDRLAIVREVESQIQEQISSHRQDELSREDVLAVLASLDPPEAYLPEDGEAASEGSRRISGGRTGTGRKAGRTGQAGGILGILCLAGAIFLPFLVWAVAMAFESEFVLLGGAVFSIVLIFVLAILSLVLSIQAGLRKAWAITGLITSLCGGLIVLLLGGGYLMMMFMG